LNALAKPCSGTSIINEAEYPMNNKIEGTDIGYKNQTNWSSGRSYITHKKETKAIKKVMWLHNCEIDLSFFVLNNSMRPEILVRTKQAAVNIDIRTSFDIPF
jgi:hypothetical protein